MGRTQPRQAPLATPSRVALAVARVEGPRLCRHPATFTGAGLSMLFAAAFLAPVAPVLQRDVLMVTIGSLPLAAGVMLAAHLAASRLHRDELLPLALAAPTAPATRTIGLLLGLCWPALAAIVWTLALLGVLLALGGIGRPASGDVAALSGTVLLLGAAGVALGRLAPAPTAGAFAVPVTAAGLWMAATAADQSVAERLVPWADWGGFRPELMIEAWPRAPWLHLAYVVLAAGTVSGLALLRDHRRPITFIAALISAVGMAAAGTQLLAVWDDPDRIAQLLRDVREPEHRLECHDFDGLDVCLPRGYEGWTDRFRAPVERTLATVPVAHRPTDLRVELSPQGLHFLGHTLDEAQRAQLPTDVRHHIDQSGTDVSPPHPGVLPVAFHQQRGTGADLQRLDLAIGAAAHITSFRATALKRLERLGFDLDPDADRDAAEEQPPEVDQQLVRDDGCPYDYPAQEVLTYTLAALAHPSHLDALRHELERRPYGLTEHGDVVVFDDWLRMPAALNTSPGPARHHFMELHTGPYSRGAAVLAQTLTDRLIERDPDNSGAYALDVGPLHAAWDRWTDPEVSADELRETFELAPLPGPVQLAETADIDPQRFTPHHQCR